MRGGIILAMRRALKILKANRLLFLILFIAALVRFMGLIPNIAHTDEAYIIKHSRLLFYNIISESDFDPHAYKYGSLIFYIQALVYIPFYIIGAVLTSLGVAQPPPTEFQNRGIDFIEYVTSDVNSFTFLEGRVLTAVLGVASVFIVYLIGKRLINHETGLLSALILAIDPFHVRDSHYITTDVPFLFFILLSLFFMTNIIRTGRLKWYILSGLAIGVSSTIKYFPLALLAYPIAILLDPRKDRTWIFKILTGVLFTLVGVFMGVPFIFNPESFSMFQYEVGRELLWYSTSLTSFLASIVSFITSLGNTKILPITTLIPTGFTEFHSSFLVFKVFGIPLTLLAFLGMVISLIRSSQKTLFLIIIPTATFVYISFYVPAVFERLSLPIVPFVALFAAIFFVWTKEVLIETFGKVKTIFLFATLLILVLYFPATSSFAGSWSCSRESGDVVGTKWLVENGIQLDKKIAIVAPFSLPAGVDKSSVEEVRPDTHFFLSELQENGFNYLFMNTGIMTRFNYQFENEFFIIPPVLFEGYFVPLSLREYKSRAPLLARFDRHPMCDLSQYFYYEIPKKESQGTMELKNFSFKNSDELKMWVIEDLGKSSLASIQFKANEGHNDKGMLEYNWTNLYYRGPRVMFGKIPVVPSRVYTFSGWIKSRDTLAPNERDGFLRLDFYTDKSNTLLPGEVVALSPRTYGEPKWRKTEVSAKAPENARFVILSLQAIGTKNINSFYFDDIEFLEGEHE